VLFPVLPGVPVQDETARKKTHDKKRSGAESNQLSDAIKTRLFDLRKRGFNRLFQNGKLFEFSTPESLLDLNFSEPVFALIDRLAVSADVRTRIVDAVEIGYREASKLSSKPPQRRQHPRASASLSAECKNDGTRYDEPELRLSAVQQSLRSVPAMSGFGTHRL
jgi:excinuclease ABC subunit A